MVITKIPYGKCTVLYRRLIVLRKKTGVAHLYFRCVPMCFCVCNNVVQDVFKANLSKAICSPQTTARHSRTPCVSKGCHTPVKGKSWVFMISFWSYRPVTLLSEDYYVLWGEEERHCTWSYQGVLTKFNDNSIFGARNAAVKKLKSRCDQMRKDHY